jgi:hypothetical protein
VFPSPIKVGTGIVTLETRHRRRGHLWVESKCQVVESRESVNPRSRSMAVVSPSLSTCEPLKGSSIHTHGLTSSKNNPKNSC